MGASSPSTGWSAEVTGTLTKDHKDSTAPPIAETGEKGGRAESAEAGPSRKSRAALGIKNKLFIAFGAMAILTSGAAAVAWYGFARIDDAVGRITRESVVSMAGSLRLAETSAEIAAMAPALITARNETERLTEQDKLVRGLDE